MANISRYISKIKTAIYGKDVRGSLADGLEAINKETEAATALSQEIDQRQTSIEKQFDDQIANMTLDDPSSAELVAARTNVNTGESYDTIGRRLDAEYADVTAQLTKSLKKIGLKSKADIFHLFDYNLSGSYTSPQGMCVTNKYIVCAVIDGTDTDNTKLYIFDKETFALVQTVEDRSFQHSNSLTYNSTDHQIVIAGNSNNLWVLDADTFATIKTVTMPYNCLGIAFDAVNNQYVVDQGNFTYHIVNNDFKDISSFTIPDTGLTKQGIACYNEIIFIPFYDGGGTNDYQTGGSADTAYSSVLYAYSLKGDLIQTYMLGQLGEIEELDYYNGSFLINFRQDTSIAFFTIDLFAKTFFTKEDVISANNKLYGFETSILSGDDLNDYIIPGTYRCNGTGLGATLLNSPTNYNFKLTVEYIQNTSYIRQVIKGYHNNEIYVRTYSGTWSDWQQISCVYPPHNLSAGDDLNNYTTAGTFIVNGTGLGATLINAPTDLNGKLIVTPIQNDNYILQVFISRTGEIFRRVRDEEGTWSIWTLNGIDSGRKAINLAGTFVPDGDRNSGVYARKIGNRVYFDGNISSTSWKAGSWQTLGTLPTGGFVPKSDKYFHVNSNAGNPITINVTATGYISVWATSTTNYVVGLNQISYFVD